MSEKQMKHFCQCLAWKAPYPIPSQNNNNKQNNNNNKNNKKKKKNSNCQKSRWGVFLNTVPWKAQMADRWHCHGKKPNKNNTPPKKQKQKKNTKNRGSCRTTRCQHSGLESLKDVYKIRGKCQKNRWSIFVNAWPEKSPTPSPPKTTTNNKTTTINNSNCRKSRWGVFLNTVAWKAQMADRWHCHGKKKHKRSFCQSKQFIAPLSVLHFFSIYCAGNM